ncbi:hypothetical protein ACLESO_40765 [Pyxidicoccus sp. 3LG]
MRPIGSSGSSSRSQIANITRRQDNQDRRIQKGIENGTLTPEEASGVKAKQAQIAEAKNEALADGKIDKKEAKQLRKLQREASRDIFEQKHNATETPATPEQRAPRIDGHQGNQSSRIQKGLGDGSLDAKEAATLMEQQTRIAEAKGQAMADGTMDEAEYNQLRQLQREASTAIFEARHNDGIKA